MTRWAYESPRRRSRPRRSTRRCKKSDRCPAVCDWGMLMALPPDRAKIMTPHRFTRPAGWVLAVFALVALAACQSGAPARPPLTAADVIQRSAEAAKSLETVHLVLEVQGITAPIANGLGLTR